MAFCVFYKEKYPNFDAINISPAVVLLIWHQSPRLQSPADAVVQGRPIRRSRSTGGSHVSHPSTQVDYFDLAILKVTHKPKKCGHTSCSHSPLQKDRWQESKITELQELAEYPGHDVMTSFYFPTVNIFYSWYKPMDWRLNMTDSWPLSKRIEGQTNTLLLWSSDGMYWQ